VSGPGSDDYAVGLIQVGDSARGRADVEALRALLAQRGAPATAPDEVGVFEVRVRAASREQALQEVFDAIAAAGADDHVAFLEHPDVPRHWRRRNADGGEAPG
jgi:SPOR domain